jgi:hypothetical protein
MGLAAVVEPWFHACFERNFAPHAAYDAHDAAAV